MNNITNDTTDNTNYCLAYIRVSTQYQANDGVSIDMQKDKIEKYCKFKKITIRGFYIDEGISGRSMKGRENLLKCLNDLQKGDSLIVYSISRLARSLKDMIDISNIVNDKECYLTSATEPFNTSTAAGKLFFQIMGAFSEYESNIDSERVKHAMAEKKSRGEHQGKPRYGWKLKSVKGSGLVPDPTEQRIIRLMINLKFRKTIENKEWSYQDVTNMLNILEIKPRSGKYWMKSSVHAIITNIGKEVVTKGREYRKVDERRQYSRVTDKNINKDFMNIDDIDYNQDKYVDINEMETIKQSVSKIQSQPPQVKYEENENGEKIMVVKSCRREIERKKLLKKEIAKIRRGISFSKNLSDKSVLLKELNKLNKDLEETVYEEDEYEVDNYGNINI